MVNEVKPPVHATTTLTVYHVKIGREPLVGPATAAATTHIFLTSPHQQFVTDETYSSDFALLCVVRQEYNGVCDL